MDIKEIREALDKLDKEKTYSDAFVGACLSCYLSSEEQDEAINKAKQEYENNKVSSDLHASFPSYCRFLLSEVERLEDKKAEMQVTIEDCKVEINKKWEDHSKLVIGLKDAVKNGNQRCAKLEKENAALREVVSSTKTLCNIICNSTPETTIKGKMQSMAFLLGHHPMILNALEKIKDE